MSDTVEILRRLGMDDIAAEIARLRAYIAELKAHCDVIEDDNKALRAIAQRQEAALIMVQEKVVRLEAEVAMRRGTLEQSQDQSQGFGIIDNVPPSTPR